MMTADYENELEDLEPDEEEYYEEDETALMEMEDETETPGRWQALKLIATDHPRISFGGGTFVLSIAVDIFVRFDPLVSILGLSAAVIACVKGEDLLELFIPAADPEDAHRVVNQVFDYPMYKDQSARAKIMRVFRQGPDSLYELAEPSEYEEEQQPVRRQPRQLPPLQKVKKLPPPSNAGGAGQDLAYERITDLFLSGKIDDERFLALIDRIENGTQIATRSARSAEPKAATEADVEPQKAAPPPAALPPGWTQEKMDLIPGLYRALGNLDKALDGIEVSRYPRNRDFARDILKQQGIWRDA